MTKYTSFLLLLVTALFSNAGNGIIATQKYTDANTKANITVTWYVSESNCKMKMEFSDEKVNSVNWFIADAANTQLLTYTEGAVPAGVSKMYFAIPLQNIKAAGAGAASIKVEKTGETKTISGINCEKMVIATEQHVTEMWVTKDLPVGFYKFTSFFQNNFEMAGLNAEKISGFPLQSVTKDKSGKVINSYSLVSASSSELSPNDFTVPGEYKLAEKGKN